MLADVGPAGTHSSPGLFLAAQLGPRSSCRRPAATTTTTPAEEHVQVPPPPMETGIVTRTGSQIGRLSSQSPYELRAPVCPRTPPPPNRSGGSRQRVLSGSDKSPTNTPIAFCRRREKRRLSKAEESLRQRGRAWQRNRLCTCLCCVCTFARPQGDELRW